MDHPPLSSHPLSDRRAASSFLRLPAAFLLLAAAAPLAAGLGRAEEAEFRASRTLPVERDQAIEIVREALAPIGVDSVDRARGRVESEPYRHNVGGSTFRTIVTAVVTRRASGVVVEVRAQRELLMETLSPGVFTPSARWRKVGTHEAILEDVLQRIEKAAGVWVDPEQEAMQEAARQAMQAAGGVVAPEGSSELAPGAWQEIARLKEERKQLLEPIRALDEQALAIVYAGETESRRAELDAIRTQRNRLWEETKPRLVELDRRILELVLAE